MYFKNGDEMKSIDFIKKLHGFTLIELMIVFAILAIILAIAIPNFIQYRNKGYCAEAEKDAENTAAAIADYFGVCRRTELPEVADLKISVSNLVEITGEPNTEITIRVTDRTRRCPIDYQSLTPGWDSNYVFTKYVD
jgi:prepilin-type N-terminal cleavage/methylation domain-containing protein